MVSLAVIGIGNFGAAHLHAARSLSEAGLANLTAVADIRLDAYPEIVAELQKRGVACHASLEELLATHPNLDLVTLPLPIHLHAPVTQQCLAHGVHVLVEKPPAPTYADAAAMAAAAERAGHFCGVGFQYSTSSMFRRICEVIAAGKLGRVTDVSVLCLAQRVDHYYARAPWAGKLRFHGNPVYDGTLNNPFAHMAQLLLSFAGAAQGRVARPVAVEAELYAAHDIESEDTNSLRATLDTGATLHFFASLCTHEEWSMEIRVTGTQGTVSWNIQSQPKGFITYANGQVEVLPESIGDDGTTVGIFRNFIDVIEGRASRLACPIEDTLGFAQLVEMTFAGERVTHLHGTPFVTRAVKKGGSQNTDGVQTYLEGIEEIARAAFQQGRLFSEVGAPWASVTA